MNDSMRRSIRLAGDVPPPPAREIAFIRAMDAVPAAPRRRESRWLRRGTLTAIAAAVMIPAGMVAVRATNSVVFHHAHPKVSRLAASTLTAADVARAPSTAFAPAFESSALRGVSDGIAPVRRTSGEAPQRRDAETDAKHAARSPHAGPGDHGGKTHGGKNHAGKTHGEKKAGGKSHAAKNGGTKKDDSGHHHGGKSGPDGSAGSKH